jgi:hypothetical protein
MPTFLNIECNRENLAPASSDAVWNCVSALINHLHEIHNEVTAIRNEKSRIIFRNRQCSRNLITIWPQKVSIRVDARASGPASLNRINASTYTPQEFLQQFENIKAAISETLQA